MGSFDRYTAAKKAFEPRVSIEVLGEAALLRALNKLDDKVRKKLTPRVMQKAAQPILRAARKNLSGHTVTGNLRRSLGTRAKTYPSGVTVVVIGPRIKRATAKRKALRGQHGYLVEFGSGPRFRKRMGGKFARYNKTQGWYADLEAELGAGGRYPTGEMPATPFLRPAYMSKRAETHRLVFKHLRTAILKEAARNANR